MDGRQTPARGRGFEDALSGSRPHPSRRGLAPVPQNEEKELLGGDAPKRRTGQMARITLRQLLDHAAEHDYGVPAFNINNMAQALAIMDAASNLDAPVIIQASRGARAYANDVMLRHMMDAVTEIYPQIPVCVHLDHGNEPATCMTAIQAGFTSVMMDGSLKADGKTPGDWDYNVGVTKTVTDMAHLGGISVEGELGVLGSLETGMAVFLV